MGDGKTGHPLQAGHQPVAWPGTQIGDQIDSAADAGDDDPGGRLGIPPIRFLIPADSVGAVVGAGGLGLREINAALAESGASVQVEPQPLLAPTGATTSTYGRSGKALAVAAHGSIDAAVRATQLVLERVDGYSAATWSAPQDVVQPGNASFAEALKSVQQRAAKLFGK